MKINNILPYLPFLLGCTGCSDVLDVTLDSSEANRKEMKVSGRIDQEYVTRADDGGFTDGDAIGVYIADYENGSTAALKTTGNHADNIKFEYSEADANWNGTAKIYWTDDNTPVDAYSYYPYVERIDDINRYRFDVSTQQDKTNEAGGMTGYEASDFLWAKAECVAPGKIIDLLHNHIMASVQVTLIEGDGFGDSWSQLDKEVSINNTRVNTTIDISSGIVSVNEGAQPVTIYPYNNGNDYRGIIAPQTVDAGTTLLTISIGAESYYFKRESVMTYNASKLHKFTIKVDKKAEGDYVFTLVNEEITPWETDTIGHDASTKAYTVINCAIPGTLENVFNEAGINTDRIEYLKLTGTMNQADFDFLNCNFRGLLALNLKELRTTGIHITNWVYGNRPGWGIHADGTEITEEDSFDDALPFNMLSEWFSGGNEPSHAPRLKSILLPDNCKYLGTECLAHLPLSGTLTIPEGVKWIGDGILSAYGPDKNKSHLSTINLPYTVEYIGGSAFANCEFTNELHLPTNLKYLGDSAFANCCNTSGEAMIPTNIKYLGDMAFSNVPLTGTVVFPAGMKKIPNSFNKTKITAIHIPEGAEEIADCAFGGRGYGGQFEVYGSELRGDIHLPNSIKKIGIGAFAGSKINHINIPTSLEVIPRDMLNGCIYLSDSIVIPDNIRRINQGAFLNCKNLKFIHIPAGIEVIGGDDSEYAWWDDSTFSGCYSLEELRCDALEPPTLIGDPFSQLDAQVHKDNFTLVVPEQSVTKYQEAKWWNEFKRISAYRNLVFRPQIAKVLNKGGSRNVILNADAGKKWTVTECPDWLNISATSGEGKTTLLISIDAMPHGSADRRGEIKVKLEGIDYVTSFTVTQYDYEYDEDESFTIQSHSMGAKGVNLVIIGDGYDAEDISNGSYLNDMQRAAERFFDLEPFKTYRQYFNIYTAFALSYESGIGSVNYLRNSKFSTSYGNWNFDSRISSNTDAAAYYCIDNTPLNESDLSTMTCLLIANGNSYDGVTMMYSNGAAVAICPKSDSDYPNDWRGLIQHEGCGHAFTKLADEYIYHINSSIQDCSCICCGHVAELKGMHSNGWGHNLSLSAKYSDIPWVHLIKDSRVNDIVDIWAGGFFHGKGVYRSEYNSVMNHNIPYMSTWCRELAVRRIMEYAGEKFEYEDFIKNDKRDWGKDFTIGIEDTRSYSIPSNAPTTHVCSPIIINGAPQRNFKGVRKENHKH